MQREVHLRVHGFKMILDYKQQVLNKKSGQISDVLNSKQNFSFSRKLTEYLDLLQDVNQIC